MASTIRIRMYRTGFGDSFLLSFGSSAAAKHVLVDFGVHMHGDIGTMGEVMEDIEKVTNKKLELVIATHQHRDHISGFGQFADRFSRFKIAEVWMPWTDNPQDKLAATIQKKSLALYDALDTHIRRGLNAPAANSTYAVALNALDNLRGNGPSTSALANGFDVGASVQYYAAGDYVSKIGSIAGLSAEILSPPRDKTFLSRMNPPSAQRFLTAPRVETGVVRPFPKYEIGPSDTDYAGLVADGQPTLSQPELAVLETMAALPADRLALTMDSLRNNTSLVVLFRYNGKTLLFPGDAQWGNWQSWIGTDGARAMLHNLDFFKIAHHGSENATPVDVVHALRDDGLAAMVPTQIQPFPTIPRMPLLDALQTHCGGHLAVRSDWVTVSKAPKAPSPPKKLPKGFKPGAVWIDYQL